MKYFISLVIALFSTAVTATSLVDEAQPWASTYQTITELGYSGNLAMVKVDGELYNPASCPKTDFYVTGWSMYEHQAKGLYMILTSAFNAKKQIKVQIYNTVCYNDRPIILSIWSK